MHGLKARTTTEAGQANLLPILYPSDLRQDYRRILWTRHPFCRFCGNRVSWRNSTLDHLLPRRRGGTDDRSNLRLACRQCNRTKGCRTPREWALDILAGAMGKAVGT